MVNSLLSFINRSPTAFHAVSALIDMLSEAGYKQLNEAGEWRVAPGGKYFVTRNQSSLIAFHVSVSGFGPARIAAAHADSPMFKLKQRPLIEGKQGYVSLNVERYGGMIYSTWFDRPLSIAGRVILRTQSGVRSRLVDFKRDMLVIPSVAIHMNREVNDGYKYNPQTDLMPLYTASGDARAFERALEDAAGAEIKDILGRDLYLYSRVPGIVWGEGGEFISAGRLDDIECAYLGARALIESAPQAGINAMCVFDNEEVGSLTRQGADSTLLTDTLRRAASELGANETDFMRACASSCMLSMDNAHAIHPNHPELSDSVNCPKLNGGIVIKESANQKYASDGVSKALLIDALERENVPYQFFANRSDMLGGSTLGNLSGRHLSVPTVDVGLAQLAMHSSWETAGAKDAEHMLSGARAYFSSAHIQNEDGAFTRV